MAQLTVRLFALSLLVLGQKIATKKCGGEQFYYDEKDIESLRCALEYLENTYGPNATSGTTPLPLPEGATLTITREKIINPAYEEVFPEVFCKRCNLKLASSNLAIVIQCSQCVDTTSKSETTNAEFRKVYIY
ncbi:hypothetical protein MTP99_016395 [Tenebrio molitor]|jgi:hypothetical protein|nr:hypothetical protein MTP99_016395 [Tenebrio molitor]CAH1374998.1 unnamed protein product [Tenebrio molitor]